jgi:hypothetical protein
MEEVSACASAERRLPVGRSADQGDRGERSMARWLSGRRREEAEGTLDPVWQAASGADSPPHRRTPLTGRSAA